MFDLILLLGLTIIILRMTRFKAPMGVIKLIAGLFSLVASVCGEFAKIFVLAAKQVSNGVIEREPFNVKVLDETGEANKATLYSPKDRHLNGRG